MTAESVTAMSNATAESLALGNVRTSCADCGLVGLCLPAAIGIDELSRLETLIADKRRIESGRTLFLQGSPATALHVVRAGSFKSSVTEDDGSLRVIGFHYPGDILGLDALGGGRHRTSAHAMERANVCEVPYERLLQVAAQIPGLQRQLLKIVAREIDHDHEHVLELGSGQAVQRLAMFVLSLSDRYRRLSRDPMRLRLPMSRGDLANYLGLALETVSRLFSRLAVAGVVEVQSRQVRVLDFEALERLCREPQAEDTAREKRG